MVWTEISRRQYRREALRYESDTMDAEWFVMEPLLTLSGQTNCAGVCPLLDKSGH
jgi:hypothetical protein